MVNQHLSCPLPSHCHILLQCPHTAYKYSRLSNQELRDEELFIDGKSIFKCNFSSREYNFDNLDYIDAETANVDRYLQSLEGEKIGYCESAMFYDEQPTTFKQSWNQRMRWSKGFYQVMFRYGRELIAMMFKKREMFVSCYDMFMTLAPATLLSIGCILLNLIFLAYGATDVHMLRRILPGTLGSIAFAGVNFYLLMFSIGFITLVTEWNKILAPANKKIKSLFTFPLFMITYVPISLVALVKKVEWKPIAHSISKSVEEIELQQQANK
jgi:cellulose synthase/poly-beta-1,6-N-acetylglucosamine synthase-like glycosyltransferase